MTHNGLLIDTAHQNPSHPDFGVVHCEFKKDAHGKLNPTYKFNSGPPNWSEYIEIANQIVQGSSARIAERNENRTR